MKTCWPVMARAESMDTTIAAISSGEVTLFSRGSWTGRTEASVRNHGMPRRYCGFWAAGRWQRNSVQHVGQPFAGSPWLDTEPAGRPFRRIEKLACARRSQISLAYKIIYLVIKLLELYIGPGLCLSSSFCCTPGCIRSAAQDFKGGMNLKNDVRIMNRKRGRKLMVGT